MSDGYGAAVPSNTATNDENSSLQTAKNEAGNVKDTAVGRSGPRR